MLSLISRPSNASTSPKKRWWMTQKRPITAKLIAKAMKSSRSSQIVMPEPVARQAGFRSPRFSTSSVIAIANTPSLKATIRENSTSFSSPPLRGAPVSLIPACLRAARDGTAGADRS